jgi:hypothetical protein
VESGQKEGKKKNVESCNELEGTGNETRIYKIEKRKMKEGMKEKLY